MKNKILITILIGILVSSSLFASTFFDDNELFNPKVTFKPISAKIEAMGGAGLATASGSDAFFINPANLANRKFSLNLPSVSVTVFNPKRIIDKGIIEGITEGEEPAKLALDFLNILNTGKGDILTTDIATSFTASGFGFGLQIQEQLHNYDNSIDTNLFAEINVAATVGLGLRFSIVRNILSIDAGVAVRPTYKFFSDAVNASGLISMFADAEDHPNPEQEFMKNVGVMAGMALPIDIGLNLNLPLGFKVSAVARNINGNFSMQKYSESGVWINEMLGVVGVDPIYDDPEDESFSEVTIEVPWSLDLGIGWIGSFGKFNNFLKPSLAFDFVDVVGLAEKLPDDPNAVWDHLKAGVELKLLSTIGLRAGINRGALSFGVGLDLFAIRVDAAYYWRELGAEIGDKAVDALTLRVNIGYDR